MEVPQKPFLIYNILLQRFPQPMQPQSPNSRDNSLGLGSTALVAVVPGPVCSSFAHLPDAQGLYLGSLALIGPVLKSVTEYDPSPNLKRYRGTLEKYERTTANEKGLQA